MSQIPFVNQLGDALEMATAHAPAPRRRLPGRRGWLVVALAVLVLGGIAAAETLRSSTNLAAGRISCISGTSNANAKVFSYDIEANGRTPQQACSPVMRRPAGRLVACDSARYGVVVYEASGRPGQCGRLGIRVLPATYAAADAHVHRLIFALARLYRAQNCIAPATLAREVDATLARLGFPGWRAALQLSPARSSTGPCGQFPATGSSASDPAASLDNQHDIVMINNGAARSMDSVTGTVGYRLIVASGRRCYTLASIQRYVRRALAAAHSPIEFASTAEQAGTQAMLGRQRYYDEGCAIVVGVGTAADGRTIQVQLQDRSSSPASASGNVPPSAYQPVLRSP